MTKGEMIDAIYKANLTKRATLIVFYLINRADKEMTCFPGVKTIAKECNMSTRTVQRALNDLVESGFLKKESRFHVQGGQRSNLYTLMILKQEMKDISEEVIAFKDYAGLVLESDVADNQANTLLEEECFKINKCVKIDKFIFPKRCKAENNRRFNTSCRGG